LPPGSTRLTRLEEDRIGPWFDSQGAHVVRGEEALDHVVFVGRKGHDVYPYLLSLLVAFFALEYLLSNRFYARPAEGNLAPSKPPAWRWAPKHLAPARAEQLV
jgi:hypothetical protein